MAPSTPKRSKKSLDKYELSPNGRAKCQKCKRKIKQGAKRVGIEEYSERYNKSIHRYFHDTCISQSAKNRLRLGGSTPQDAIARQRKEKIAAGKLLQQRSDLRETLRRLRLEFARRLRLKPFFIFYDTVLDEITVKMPTNKRELLAISGIAEKKYQSFGEPILHVVRHYHRRYARAQRQESADTQKPPARATSSKVRAAQPPVQQLDAVNNNLDDDGVAALETLSCEDIVKTKFEHAAANGYVISIE